MADNTSNRGFASMDDSLQEEISRKGGEASGGGNKSKSTGRGSNLSKEDRAKGGKHSHGGGRRS
jgi:uncharacterized protein